ncbi:MAG: sulfatase, partial [Candidatus Aminicenantes bacterium]|nr:sulfatase [Candidatus Aminicenantes bacterium]
MGKNRSVHSILFLCIFLSAALFASPSSLKKNPDKGRLNVLLISIDTLRADRLSCYSRKHIRTPNIDSLAEKGVLFSRAFANTPTTLPSHAGILTGTTPLYHGVHENGTFVLQEDFLTLAEHLKSFEYSTGAFIGAYPLDSKFGLAQGFDVYNDDYSSPSSEGLAYVERKAGEVVDQALEWLKTSKSPWFLFIHCFDPHTPYEPPEPFKTKNKNHLYEGEIAYVDNVLEHLLNYLEEKDLYDKTLIVFTGDHGESLGQHGEKTHGFFAYNTTLWIPLLISAPGVKPGRVDQYVSHIDIFPFVCDILKIKKPSFLQGISLLPAIKGKKLAKRPIYFEALYPYYSRG